MRARRREWKDAPSETVTGSCSTTQMVRKVDVLEQKQSPNLTENTALVLHFVGRRGRIETVSGCARRRQRVTKRAWDVKIAARKLALVKFRTGLHCKWCSVRVIGRIKVRLLYFNHATYSESLKTMKLRR